MKRNSNKWIKVGIGVVIFSGGIRQIDYEKLAKDMKIKGLTLEKKLARLTITNDKSEQSRTINISLNISSAYTNLPAILIINTNRKGYPVFEVFAGTYEWILKKLEEYETIVRKL
jgi:hypothetical protein